MSDDPSTELLNLVAAFTEALWNLVKGATGAEKLVQETFKSYRVLKIAIRHTAPDFRPFENAAKAQLKGAETDGEWDMGTVVGDEALPPNRSEAVRPMYLQDLRKHIQKSVSLTFRVTVAVR
jgi:hypothetical protein